MRFRRDSPDWKDTHLALADLIPQLSDVELANLSANAHRLAESGTPAQMAAAADIMPLIEAQLADRLARKPVKAKVVRKKKLVVEEAADSPAA